MKTVLGQFKGNPTITLNPGAKYPFSFGADKAHMIVECFAEIQAFAQANPRKQKPAAPSKLVLSVVNGAWYAEEVCEPKRSQIIKLFGTACIQTPFLSTMPGEQVKSALQERNPGAEIVFFQPAAEPKETTWRDSALYGSKHI